jgi:DNA-binding NtrC family response regulator
MVIASSKVVFDIVLRFVSIPFKVSRDHIGIALARHTLLYTPYLSLSATLAEIERCAIEATLDYTGGDKTCTARTLRIGRKTLYRKLLGYQKEGATD